MSDIKLKPCPFCTNEYPGISSDGGCRYWKVFCSECRCSKDAPYDNDTEEGAIKSWNRRVFIVVEE